MTHNNLSNTRFIPEQNETSIFIPYLPSELFEDDMPDIKETLIKLMNSIGLFNIKRVDISKHKNGIIMAFIHFHYWENTDQVICIRNLMDIQGYYHVDLKIAFKPIKKYIRLLYNKNPIPDIEPELNIVQMAAVLESTEKRIIELQKNDIIQKETIKWLSEDLNEQKSHYITEFNYQTTQLYESNDKNELLEKKIDDLNNLMKIKDEVNKDLVLQVFNKTVEHDALKLDSEYKTTWNHSLNSTTVNYIESLREINKGYYIEISILKTKLFDYENSLTIIKIKYEEQLAKCKKEHEIIDFDNYNLYETDIKLKKTIKEKEEYIIKTETAYRSALERSVSYNTILSNKCDALKTSLNYELKIKNELNIQHEFNRSKILNLERELYHQSNLSIQKELIGDLNKIPENTIESIFKSLKYQDDDNHQYIYGQGHEHGQV